MLLVTFCPVILAISFLCVFNLWESVTSFSLVVFVVWFFLAFFTFIGFLVINVWGQETSVGFVDVNLFYFSALFLASVKMRMWYVNDTPVFWPYKWVFLIIAFWGLTLVNRMAFPTH